jgi:hypothetical protein
MIGVIVSHRIYVAASLSAVFTDFRWPRARDNAVAGFSLLTGRKAPQPFQDALGGKRNNIDGSSP